MEKSSISIQSAAHIFVYRMHKNENVKMEFCPEATPTNTKTAQHHLIQVVGVVEAVALVVVEVPQLAHIIAAPSMGKLLPMAQVSQLTPLPPSLTDNLVNHKPEPATTEHFQEVILTQHVSW